MHGRPSMPKKLWNDLGDHFVNNRINPSSKDYFLGSVLLHNDNEKLMVFDGQQRLATITMILCIARDLIHKYQMHDKNPKMFKELEEKFDKTIGNNKKWRINLNDVDQEIFQKIQDKTENAPSSNSLELRSHKKLIRNYNTLYNMMVDSICNNFNNIKLSSADAIMSKSNESIIKRKICKKHYCTY